MTASDWEEKNGKQFTLNVSMRLDLVFILCDSTIIRMDDVSAVLLFVCTACVCIEEPSVLNFSHSSTSVYFSWTNGAQAKAANC